MSELPSIKEKNRPIREFAGFKDLKHALDRARQLLDARDVAEYIEPRLNGASNEEIAVRNNTSISEVTAKIDSLEIQLAERHLQQYLGRASGIDEMVRYEEILKRSSSSDNSTNR